MSIDHGNTKSTAITKNAMGETAIQRTGETASTAIAAREQAWIQSRIVQAMKAPRVFEKVRESFKADCDRPRFAMVARFHKPQGWVTDPETNRPITDARGDKIRNFVKGWSIRAIEAATRAMGNIDMTSTTIFEDDEKEIVECRVWDLERNSALDSAITVPKTVERKFLKKGQVPLSSRQNSYGDTVYLLPATDDEVRMARGRLVSMTLRTLAQRLIPGDLFDEFLDQVEALRAKAIEDEKAGVLKDPKAAMRGLLDRLASIGIRAADVVEYLGGRSIEAATPEQILELRIVGADVAAGNYSWRDAVAGSPYREQPETPEGAPEDTKAAEARKRIEATLEAAKKKKAEKGADKPAEPTPAAPATPAAASPPPSAPPVATREPGED